MVGQPFEICALGRFDEMVWFLVVLRNIFKGFMPYNPSYRLRGW